VEKDGSLLMTKKDDRGLLKTTTVTPRQAQLATYTVASQASGTPTPPAAGSTGGGGGSVTIPGGVHLQCHAVAAAKPATPTTATVNANTTTVTSTATTSHLVRPKRVNYANKHEYKLAKRNYRMQKHGSVHKKHHKYKYGCECNHHKPKHYRSHKRGFFGKLKDRYRRWRHHRANRLAKHQQNQAQWKACRRRYSRSQCKCITKHGYSKCIGRSHSTARHHVWKIGKYDHKGCRVHVHRHGFHDLYGHRHYMHVHGYKKHHKHCTRHHLHVGRHEIHHNNEYEPIVSGGQLRVPGHVYRQNVHFFSGFKSVKEMGKRRYGRHSYRCWKNVPQDVAFDPKYYGHHRHILIEVPKDPLGHTQHINDDTHVIFCVRLN
jgi:hypothetical protein